MKRGVIMVLAVLVPLGFLFSAWQGYQWQELTREIHSLEAQQADLLEANRRLLVSAAEQESPLIVVDKARDKLGMDWPEQDQIRTLIINGGGERGP